MPVYEHCSRCALFSGFGRCSFNRLVAEAVLRGLVVDYVEAPSYIRVECAETSFYCNPEEAHALVCAILRDDMARVRVLPPVRPLQAQAGA